MLDAGFWLRCDLLWSLVRRDLSAKYQGSVLGNFWPLANQLVQLLIYTYVFSVILKVRLDLKGMPEGNVTFGLWVFAGLVPWFAFTTGLFQAARAVIDQPNLVKKVVFPLKLLPLVPILSAFLESSMGLMALIVAAAIATGKVHPTLGLLPLVWVPQLLFTTGLGYLAASLSVFLRDIPQTVAVILNIWFYLTPLVYPARSIPEAWRPWVLWCNPIAAIAETYRDLILAGQVQHGAEWATATAIALVVFGLGSRCYERLRPAFADTL